jgi:hypothetical protein
MLKKFLALDWLAWLPEPSGAAWRFIAWTAFVFNLMSGIVSYPTWIAACNLFVAGFCAQWLYELYFQKSMKRHREEMERINAEFQEISKVMELESNRLAQRAGLTTLHNDPPKPPSMH